MGWWGLCGSLIAGAGQSEPWETDYSSSAPSRVTHVAQCVVFGAVMADAAMLDRDEIGMYVCVYPPPHHESSEYS
jgi:hypothetical protein